VRGKIKIEHESLHKEYKPCISKDWLLDMTAKSAYFNSKKETLRGVMNCRIGWKLIKRWVCSDLIGFRSLCDCED
jgi:hypothetical protein